MQKSRRGARELALDVLYRVDIVELPLGDVLTTALKRSSLSESARQYALTLVFGTLDHLLEIDGKLRNVSPEWPPRRQAVVDRNILRIAVFEIDYVGTVPHVVAVDEAIELAKKFGSSESATFVSGVTGAYLREFVRESVSGA